MCIVCNERKSGKSRDVSVDDLKRSRSPLGPHRSKLVIICLTFQLLLDLWWSGWKGIGNLTEALGPYVIYSRNS